MKWSLYVDACLRLAQELRESLPQTVIDQLREDLDGLPLADWRMMRSQGSEEIAAYVAATPSQRARRVPPDQAGFLTLAAIQHCLDAAELLDRIDRAEMSVGCSYRNMAARAGMVFAELRDYAACEWPFAGASPFV